jgi:hypothetical protein
MPETSVIIAPSIRKHVKKRTTKEMKKESKDKISLENSTKENMKTTTTIIEVF